MVKAKKGNVGLSNPSSLIKWARICACIWFTAINGISKANAKDFAKEAPTKSEPISPGP